MKIAAVGVGGAGSRIVDALYRDDRSRQISYLAGVQAIDTDLATLQELSSLPEQSKQTVRYQQPQSTGGKPRGESASPDIEDRDVLEMRRIVDSTISSDIAALVLIAGLGGDTGSVVTPRLAKALREVYDMPVYSVSVLPAIHEETPQNPAKPLQALYGVVDAQIVFDNDAWVSSEDELIEAVSDLNNSIVERLGGLFSAGETAEPDAVGQRVVDASEIIATLDAGGLATIGYASQTIDVSNQSHGNSLIGTLRNLVSSSDEVDNQVQAIKAIETTLRRAVRGRLTLDCPLDTAASGLLVVSGPPDWLHQSAISDGQRWLSEEIESVQLRTGDNPLPRDESVSILTIFAGIQDAPRIKELATSDS